jgi:hypothetical protein
MSFNLLSTIRDQEHSDSWKHQQNNLIRTKPVVWQSSAAVSGPLISSCWRSKEPRSIPSWLMSSSDIIRK